jgi:hypothetical protein
MVFCRYLTLHPDKFIIYIKPPKVIQRIWVCGAAGKHMVKQYLLSYLVVDKVSANNVQGKTMCANWQEDGLHYSGQGGKADAPVYRPTSRPTYA